MIEVPNEFYFPYNYTFINMLMPSHMPPRKSPASHLSLFTRNTLFKVLKSSGFTAVTVKTEGFANKHRVSTPTFKQKTLIIKLALLLCRLHIDTFLGLGRYLIAVAHKNLWLFWCQTHDMHRVSNLNLWRPMAFSLFFLLGGLKKVTPSTGGCLFFQRMDRLKWII